VDIMRGICCIILIISQEGDPMRRSRIEVYLHFVWATWHREPIITSCLESSLYHCIEMEANRLGCDTLAIGGMPDHIHLVLKIPATHSISDIMKRIKGVSSTFARTQIGEDNFFGWQDNYGVLSFSSRNKSDVIHYVLNQKRHHSLNTLWEDAERMFEIIEEE
jgi:putative transposase